MSTLVGQLGNIARQHPAHIALSDASGDLSYAALWEASQRLASHLQQRGCRQGDRIALILPNRNEAVIANYAAWLLGAVFVPLNAQARQRDFAVWLQHAQARFLIHESGQADIDAAVAELSQPPQRIVLAARNASTPVPASADWQTAMQQPCWSGILPDGDALAAILYTSGTTGAPKGVMLSHANFVANVDAIVSYLELQASDSIATILPFYYSYGASVLHTHLRVGARVLIEQNLVFPHLLIETLARERISGFSGVPSTYSLLLDRVALEDYDLSALRYLTQAGGPMTPALTKRLRAALPQARLFVMYGQTEATARLACLSPELLEQKLGSVGLPIAGVEIAIRDSDDQPLPAGVTGQVCARGANVMQGYWHDAEASAATLKDGWLHTGDLGHLDDDGFLHLLGRRSDMIKTGAHRVHPLDVEEVIAEYEGVREVAVIGIDDAVLGQAIKAIVVPCAGVSLNPRSIQAHCRQRLAMYKIPKLVEFIDQLPRTASGKLRRAELARSHAPQEPS
ncbi:MAG: class I adenylate-forming enzyme family protein [Dokdonella sp.]